MTSPSESSDVESARLLRAFVLVALVVGLAGVAADLLVLKHYEDSWQLAPLVLLALAFVAIAWYLAGGGAPSLRLLQGTMALFLAAGVMGVVLHYRGNLEFQLEIDPGQHGWDLFTKVIHAKAPPALAPGAMAQLGLLGLAYVFRHPALKRASERSTSSEGA